MSRSASRMEKKLRNAGPVMRWALSPPHEVKEKDRETARKYYTERHLSHGAKRAIGKEPGHTLPIKTTPPFRKVRKEFSKLTGVHGAVSKSTVQHAKDIKRMMDEIETQKELKNRREKEERRIKDASQSAKKRAEKMWKERMPSFITPYSDSQVRALSLIHISEPTRPY